MTSLRGHLRHGGSPLWLAAALVSASVGTVTLALGHAEPTLALAAALCWVALAMAALPLLRVRGLDAFCSPWLILWVLLLHGWALKATLALVQDGPGGVREAVLMGGPPGLLLDGILLGGIGLAALAAGWAVAGPLLSRRRARPHRSILARLDVRRWSDWNIRRLTVVVWLLIAISMLGIVGLYVDGGLIGKRFNGVPGGAANRMFSASYLYLRMSYLGHTAFIPLWAARMKFGRLPSRALSVALPVSAGAALAGPFMSDSRAGLGIVFVDAFLLAVLLRRESLRWSRVLPVAAGLVAAFVVMLTVRGNTSLSRAMAGLFGGRDLFDLGKMGHIYQLPPGVLRGETLWGWALALLPQSILPFSKPMWSGLGAYVWEHAYRPTPNNIPASLPGELWLNGGWPAVVVGMLLFGALAGYLYRRLAPGLRHGEVLTSVLYAIGFVRFFTFGLCNDLGTAFWNSLSDLVPILLVLLIVRSHPRPTIPAVPTGSTGASARMGAPDGAEQ